MKNDSKKLHEAIALRYFDLAGLKESDVISEEKEEIDPTEAVEDAFAGGENLVNPVDHVAAVSDLTEEKVSEIVAKVFKLIKENQSKSN